MFGLPYMIHVGVVCVTWCFSMTAAVLECACATGCNYTNMCVDLGENCFQRNVALGRPATISSMFNSAGYQQLSGPACLAVNGNTDGELKPINKFPDSPNCVYIVDAYSLPYWQVDLGQSYQIQHITVYPSKGYEYQLDGVDISVDAAMCKSINRVYYSSVTCDRTLRGKIITLKKQSGFLMFCEVQVWVAFCYLNNPFGLKCPDCGHCKTGATCDSSLNCPHGCETGWSGSKCDKTCYAERYEPSCTNQCGHCTNDMCNSVTGTCTQGCQDGYQSPMCNDPCIMGTYGPGCSKICDHCKYNTCNHVDGTCTNGCQDGYQSALCNVPCIARTYGPGCSKICDHCKDNTCNHVNGTCTYGCQDGYQSALCDEPCTIRTYGPGCSKTCGYCKDNTCNYVDGTCTNGCQDGYQSAQCDVPCPDKYFGANCSQKCGNCVNKGQCDFKTGYCPGGCESGWKGDYCTENCTDGEFGINCTHECGHCANKSSCNAKTGYCLGGCEIGWQGDLCNENCRSNTYGQHCQQVCGHCANQTSCDWNTGRCPGPCVSGWQGEKCTELIPDKVVNIPAVAGSVSVIFVILIALIAVIGIFKFRRRRQGKTEANTNDSTTRHENSKNQNTDGRPSFELVSPQDVTAAEYSNTSEANVVRRKDLEKMKPKIAMKPTLGNPSASFGPSEHIYVNVEGDILRTVSSRTKRDSVDLLPDLEGETDSTYRKAESIYATFKASRPELDNVQQSLVDILASEQLSDQFKNLPHGLTDEHDVAMLPENIKKNRYYSVLPYDKNRVILTDGYSIGKATDYINASYISGFRHEKTYIAAQGPRDNTAGDLWRMIWQEHVSQIVMLTGLIESGKNKCFEYWPPLDMSEMHGPVTVTAVDVQHRIDFLIRNFVIKKAGNSEERKVEQFHYLAWPDHGVPSVSSLLNFWRFAKSRGPSHPPPPVLVHCTAGVGRTGTFIGLDIAYEHAIARKEVNVFEIVMRMRQERCAMIQAVEQYEFLHEIVLEAYTAKDTLVLVDLFTKIFDKPISIFTENKRIDEEFQSAMQMSSVRKPLGTHTAMQAVNKDKIRNRNSIPADNSLVYLTAHVPTRNRFLNAVYMPTYQDSRGHVMTQLPLQETLVDFWRLMDGCDVKMIVSLGSDLEQKTVKDFCQYWPKEAGTFVVTGPYKLRNKATHSLGKNVTSYLIIMEKHDQSSREVQLLRYRDWAGELPGNTSEFLQFVETLERIRPKERKPAPVVIQCMDGVAKCGLFCTLCNIVSRLTYDREVDVYMAVREVHSVSPQAIASLAQYRYCYQVAQQRVSDLNIYANA